MTGDDEGWVRDAAATLLQRNSGIGSTASLGDDEPDGQPEPRARPPGGVGLAAKLIALGVALLVPASVRAGDRNLFDDGNVALWARTLASIEEPPVPVFHNGVRVDDPETPGDDLYNVVEIYDQVPDTTSFPLTWADLVANTFVRPTYQNSSGTSGTLGTSIVGTPSYRRPGGSPSDFRFIPSVNRADVWTSGTERIQITVSADFEAASVTSTRTYMDPVIGATETVVSVRFEASKNIPLDDALRGKDVFRLLTLSSAWTDPSTYDGNVLRYEDASGGARMLRMDTISTRGEHILQTGAGLGSWFELVKEPGSNWFPDSPTIRVEILATRGLSGHLGIQGFLADTEDPNEDSLSIWVEWLDVLNPISAGTVVEADFRITAVPPAPVPICTGDCNDDGSVTIDELTAGIRLIFEDASPTECPSFDAAAGSRIGVHELIEALYNALNGCSQ
jgi:hypothetical protein